jgi:hypothetical protein
VGIAGRAVPGAGIADGRTLYCALPSSKQGWSQGARMDPGAIVEDEGVLSAQGERGIVRLRCPPELRDRLPLPVPARRALPPWLKSMAASAPSADLGGRIRTVKHCPPFIDAMGCGFLLPLVTNVRVSAGRFDWSWDPGVSSFGRYLRSPLSFHFAEQLEGVPFGRPDEAVIKFTNYWTIETEPGWSLLVTHPFNREDLPFRTLAGLVDTDRYRAGCIQFPALWTDPDFEGVLARGTPVAQCVPVPRRGIELELGTLEGEEAEAFLEVQEAVNTEPGTYRRRFRAPKS